MQLPGNLLQGGVSSKLRQQPLIHRPVVLHSLTDLLAHARVPGGNRHRFGEVKPDSPIPEGRIIPSGIALHRFPQSQASFLNQIQQQHAKAGILPRKLNHPAQAQVGQGFSCPFVSGSAALRQEKLIPICRKTSQFLQVQPQRISLLQLIGGKPAFYQLHFPAQPKSCLSGDGGAG